MAQVRLVLIAAAGALVILGSLLAVDLVRFLPDWVRGLAVEWAFGAVAALYVAAGRWVGWPPGPSRLARGLDRLDRFAWWMLRRGLFLAVAVVGGVWLATWLPHYLQWPWSRDTDTFAVIAREWSEGVLPYRDIRGYNFPGHIYLHWILGKAVGWGRPWTYYGVDALALLVLGGVAVAWGRRRLRSATAGAAAALTVFAFYLDQGFEIVGQRDWHVAMAAILGVLILETWPGRPGRWLSAMLAAGALLIRPHAVLFLPALILAAGAGGRGGWRNAAARGGEWGLAFALLAAVGFAPLALTGILDDLIRWLRVASYGGPYSTFTADRGLAILIEQLWRPTTAGLLAILGILSLPLRPRFDPLAATARTWLLVVIGAILYRPLHPVDHYYLTTPLALSLATAWAIPIAWCLRAATETPEGRRTPFVGLLAVLLLLYEVSPIAPRFLPYNSDAPAALRAIRAAAVGDPPPRPPGAWYWYGPKKHQPYYTWDDYNRLLRYIRETTGPETIVANVLKNPPFPAVNGPAGRRSPFRAESGIAWMWLVRQDLDETFARELRDAGADSVVVWAPAEVDSQPRLPLKRLTRVILDEYAPEARFGLIEIRRRKPEGDRGRRSSVLTPSPSNL